VPAEGSRRSAAGHEIGAGPALLDRGACGTDGSELFRPAASVRPRKHQVARIPTRATLLALELLTIVMVTQLTKVEPPCGMALNSIGWRSCRGIWICL
jgi:hypothetical protein